jgi:NitT/TauT family transport system permease protein
MKSIVPILTVVAAIVAIWYAGAFWMNSKWALEQAERNGVELSIGEVFKDAMTQERAILPAPHQVVAELWKTTVEQKITSKRSLVFHGWVTLHATLWGFALGAAVGLGLAISIVYLRVMDMSVMPWAIISQTIPIVAIAPMIIVVMTLIGVQERLVPKAIISAYLCFFPILVGMVKGLRSPDMMQLDLMKTYSASSLQSFWKLRLPSSMPYLFTSMKIGIAAALVGTIVGELPTGALRGLGARILVGDQFGPPIRIWSALMAASILAGALVATVGLIQRITLKRMGMAR